MEVRTGSVRYGSTREWLGAHMIDILALPLATALNLRLWFLFFGIRNRLFIAAIIAASLCEVMRRIVAARRRSQRPRIFAKERRFDFVAALLVGTGPWPVVPSLSDASPLALLWRSYAVPEWLALTAGTVILTIAFGRLIAQCRRPRIWRHRSIRRLPTIPDVHTATMIVLPDVPRPAAQLV